MDNTASHSHYDTTQLYHIGIYQHWPHQVIQGTTEASEEAEDFMVWIEYLLGTFSQILSRCRHL